MLPNVERSGHHFEGEIRFINWKHKDLMINPGYDQKTMPLAALLKKIASRNDSPSVIRAVHPVLGKPMPFYIDSKRGIVVRIN